MAKTEPTEESGGRKRRLLVDGRSSRGYVALEVEALEAPISAEAIGLLVLIRHDCQVRESDGEIEARALQAVAAYCELPRARLTKLLGELSDAGLLKLQDCGARDVNYATWGRTRDERQAERERWRGRKQKSRDEPSGNPPVTPMSRRDSKGIPPGVTGGVTAKSRPPEAEAEVEVAPSEPYGSSEKVSDLKPLVSEPTKGVRLPAVADPRTELGDRLVVEIATLVAGGVLSPLDQKRIQNWPYAFQHLTGRGEEGFLSLCRRRAEEAVARGEPIRGVKYFEGLLGDADADAVDNQPSASGRSHTNGPTRISAMLPPVGQA